MANNYQDEIAKILIDIESIKFSFDNPFILTSGYKSPLYVDCRKIISYTNISIPKIYEIDSEKKIILLEDFGDRRFDKIMKYNNIKNLLSVAVDSLIILRHT